MDGGGGAAGVVERALVGAAAALEALRGDRALLAGVSAVPAELVARLRAGGKVMAVGNGGSAADAMHFAEELTGRFREERPAIAALACTDAGHLSCVANDYGWERVFSRWVEALGRPGDVLVALSTSGNSPNIVLAVKAARERGMFTVALLGRGGGKAAGLADRELVFPGEGSDRIQELHMLTLHAWVEAVEAGLRAG
jgi:D-sedoheptulose 7-phosphate isomerase